MAQNIGVRIGVVVGVEDDKGGGRIKVKISPEDNGKRDEELQYAFPLMPKIFFVEPKNGEAVFVFLTDENNANSQRFYLGPITSQLDKIFSQEFILGSAAIFDKPGNINWNTNPETRPELNGVFPKTKDVAILGRKNTDIILKEDDIRIRAGVKKVNDDNHFDISYNEEDPSFIKLEYHKDAIRGSKSTAAVKADKIFLVGNNNRDTAVQISQDRDKLISDEDLAKLIEEGYKLPYGEKLVDFLLKFVDVFSKHTHDYVGKPPNASFISEINNAALDPLNNKKMLSNTVRIN